MICRICERPFKFSRLNNFTYDLFRPELFYSGKKHRIIFSDSQSAQLREAFESNPYLSKPDRRKLAESLDISEENVSVIFCNLNRNLATEMSRKKGGYNHYTVGIDGRAFYSETRLSKARIS